jgi:hypothetical protein
MSGAASALRRDATTHSQVSAAISRTHLPGGGIAAVRPAPHRSFLDPGDVPSAKPSLAEVIKYRLGEASLGSMARRRIHRWPRRCARRLFAWLQIVRTARLATSTLGRPSFE